MPHNNKKPNQKMPFAIFASSMSYKIIFVVGVLWILTGFIYCIFQFLLRLEIWRQQLLNKPLWQFAPTNNK